MEKTRITSVHDVEHSHHLARQFTQRLQTRNVSLPQRLVAIDYTGISDGALIMLAGLVLKRARLSIPAPTTRDRAISIIRSIRPVERKR